MRFLTSVSWTAAFLLLVFTPYSLASYGAGLPRLQHERRTIEKRTLFGSLNSLFSKRDDCATQYGPTYVDCGPRGCYQPSLGEICCGDESDYCLVGQFCVGLNCCPNGLTASCCGTGFNCPANVSDYYTTTSTTPPQGTTSLPVAVSTSVKASTTSTKSSTSAVAVLTTTSAPTTLKITSSVVVVSTTSRAGTPSGTSSTNTGGAATSSSTFVPASGAQEIGLRMGIEGVAVVVLGVGGFVAGLL